MRKFLLSVCGLFLIFAARAQGVEISVRNDADEALFYACLYVNGKAVAVTPEGAVTLSEPEYASDRSEKRSHKRDK